MSEPVVSSPLSPSGGGQPPSTVESSPGIALATPAPSSGPTCSQVLTYIKFGLPLLGLAHGLQELLRTVDPAKSNPIRWLEGVLGLAYWTGIYSLAGLVLAALLRFLDLRMVLSGARSQDLQRAMERMSDWADRVAQSPQVEHPSPSSGLDGFVRRQVIEFRQALRSRDWAEAELLLQAIKEENPEDGRLESLEKEYEVAKQSVRDDHLAQIAASRDVNDADRVLELHQNLTPLLEADARHELDLELSQWFLSLIGRRLSTRPIQAEVVLLAGRVAEIFGGTVHGASLRAALPTLRRSAGLCPRCGQPFRGPADACPTCLAEKPGA